MVEQKPLKLVVSTPNTIAEMNSSAGDTLQEALLPSSVAKLTATQTLTNKTLTAPAINLIESKTAANATIVAFASTPGSAVGSACDHVKIINAASGGGALVQAENSGSADVDLNLAAKGSGIVKAGGSQVVTASSTTIMTNKTLNYPVLFTPSIGSTDFASANHGHTDSNSGGRLSGAAINSSVRGVALRSNSAAAKMQTASSYRTLSGFTTDNYTGVVPALSDFSSGETTGAFGGQPYMTTRSRLSYINHISCSLSTASTGFISFGPQWRISGPSSANSQEQAGHYTNWFGPAAVAGGPYETQYYVCNTVGSSSVLNDVTAYGKLFEIRLAGRLISSGTATVWNLGMVMGSTGAPGAITLSTGSLAAGTYMVSVSFLVGIGSGFALNGVVTNAQFVNSSGVAQPLTGSVFTSTTGISPSGTARYLGIQIGNSTAMATGTPSFNGIIAGWEHN